VVAPKDLFPAVDELAVTMQHEYEPRGLPYGDAYVLPLITAAAAPKRIFEIGTGTGRATLAMLRQAPDAQIDTLDLGTQEGASLGAEEGDLPIGDSAAFDFIRPGGTIIWDDCHLMHAGVSKALLQLRRDGHSVHRLTGSRLAILRTRPLTTQGDS